MCPRENIPEGKGGIRQAEGGFSPSFSRLGSGCSMGGEEGVVLLGAGEGEGICILELGGC